MQKQNPYIGPRPYERGETQNFFGREREGKELAWLILAERAVLFYAQSGAGKTSLLNARVIPYLEEKSGVQVLPVARVGSGLPEGITPDIFKVEDTTGGSANRNIFVFSALLALSADLKIPPADLLDHTLLSYLQKYALSPIPNPQSLITDPQSPTLLIFDQFEEIATTHREHWTQAEGFFRQVREAIDALPALSVLFALREDYVAELDPYTPLLPSHLQARFRMTLPTHSQAMQIVMGPAEQAECRFTEEAAQNLVTNLGRIKGRGTEGGIGQYVEPVQLQVVCQQLWESLPESVSAAGVITWDAIKDYDVDHALTSFYESTLVQTCQVSENLTGLHVTERRLRRWFSEALITPEGRRGLALWNETTKETAGLPNAVVRTLESHYLIRSDSRGGSRWYELSHDRLVEPIVQSNREWEAARETPLRTAARQWKESQNEGVLYRDKMLDEVLAWAKVHPDEVEDYENEFLKASQRAEQAYKMKRSRRMLAAGLLTSVLIIAILGMWAYRQSQIATARQLAAQAQIVQVIGVENGLIKSVLMATESMRRVPLAETYQSLYTGLELLPNLIAQKEGLSVVWSIDVSPNGKWLAATGPDGLMIWDTATWTMILQVPDITLSLAFSVDNQWLATGGEDYVVRLWDTETWTTTIQLAHEDVVNTITFGPDNLLAAMSAAGTLRVWQRTTHDWTEIIAKASGPAVVSPLRVVSERATCDVLATQTFSKTFEYALRRSVVFSSDKGGRFLAAIGIDNIVRVWDRDTDTWHEIPHTDTVLSIAFSPDGAWLATAGRDNQVHVWNTDTWIETFPGVHACAVNALAFSLDGQYLASVSDDRTASVWNVASGFQVMSIQHDGAVWAVSFSPDGKRLATGSLDGTARLWDVNTGREMKRMERGRVWALTFVSNDRLVTGGQVDTPQGSAFNVWNLSNQVIKHQNAVVVTAFSSDGRWFATAGWDGFVKVWDMQKNITLTLQAYDDVESGHAVWDIAFSPDNTLLAAACGDGHIRVWDVATGQRRAKLQQGGAWDTIMAVDWSPDGQWLASGSRLTARIWDWDISSEQGATQVIATMDNGARVQDLEFSPDGQWLATAGQNGKACVWDAATGDELICFEHKGPVWDIAFSPNGKLLASASEDWTARLWDIAAKKELIRWGHQAYVHEVAFSPDGLWLAAASWDGTITVWSTKLLIHRPIATLYHEGERVWTLAFSPDGQYLATGTRDGTVRVWQALTGREVFRVKHVDISSVPYYLREMTIQGTEDISYFWGLVATVTFSPDGRWLVSGSIDGTARIWNWQLEDVIDEACTRLPRNLTHQEWRRYLPWHLYHRTCPNLPIPQDK